jgi:radical SAM protein with 4Fe4S-binding SPASM domain
MKEYLIHNRIRLLFNAKMRRLSSWLIYGNPRFPEGIGIELSTECNRRCYYCPTGAMPFGRQEIMTDEVFLKVLDRMHEIRWPGTIQFNFLNEPLLYPDLCKRISQTRQSFPFNRLIMFSNGDFLTLAKMEELVKAGLNEIWITDHVSSRNYTPAYQAEWRKKIAEIYSVYSKYIVLRGKLEEKSWLSNCGGSSKPKNARTNKRCEIVHTWFSILYNGDVNLCCCEPRRKYIQGNIMNQSIMDIWKNTKMKDIRQASADGKPLVKECKDCLAGNQK